jgi:peptide/nickel transport system substrate-binding protein
MKGGLRTIVRASLVVAGALGAGGAWAQGTQARFQCPVTGGQITYAQGGKANSLDQHVSNTVSTRNIGLNIFESLMTRDASNSPIPELAESVAVAPDGLTYTFKLRRDVRFHNGKPMTSADVVASFDRYLRVGWEKATLTNVEKWTAPDASTFVIQMKRRQPTFLEELSSFVVPIVIIPAEQAAAAPMRLEIVGTGPYQLAEFVPDSHVRLKRYDQYRPNTAHTGLNGFGGYKQACLDTVMIRFVSEAGARVAGLETGEFHIIESVPAKARPSLEKNKSIVLTRLDNWGVNIATVNYSAPPTDKLLVRRAVQAALDMDEIMQAATDGLYRLNIGFQYPNNAAYSERGKEFYNVKDPALARRLLKEAGYANEPIVLLTNKDYPAHYNAAVVMAEQLKGVGINAQLRVLDWPTSIQTFEKESSGWHYFFTTWVIAVASGPTGSLKFLAPPQNTYKPQAQGPAGPDKVFEDAWSDMLTKPSVAERQEAFARAQHRVMEQGMALPFGASTVLVGSRADVKGFEPYLIPRFANMWLQK